MREGEAILAKTFILVLAGCALAIGCQRQASNGKVGPRAKDEAAGAGRPTKPKEATVDPRIPTEVIMAEAGLREAGYSTTPAEAQKVQAHFRAKIAEPLNRAASGSIGRRELIEKLAAAVGDDDSYVSMQAAMALDRLADKKDKLLAEAMLRTLGNERAYVRGNAAAVLQTVGDLAAVQPLIGLLADANPAIAVNTAAALGEIGDARAIEPLISLLGRLKKGRCSYNRSSTEHIVPRVPMMWMIDKELEARYRQAGENPDYATASFSAALVPLLEKENKDLCDYVRWHAADALRKITGKRFGERSELWQMWWQNRSPASR